MPKGGARKGSGQKKVNLYRRSVGVTQEMFDKGLTDAKSIRDAALKKVELEKKMEELGKELRSAKWTLDQAADEYTGYCYCQDEHSSCGKCNWLPSCHHKSAEMCRHMKKKVEDLGAMS